MEQRITLGIIIPNTDQGVGTIVDKVTAPNDRVMLLSINSHLTRKKNIVYAPRADKHDGTIEAFYEQIETDQKT